jgi:hypothetical protein
MDTEREEGREITEEREARRKGKRAIPADIPSQLSLPPLLFSP